VLDVALAVRPACQLLYFSKDFLAFGFVRNFAKLSGRFGGPFNGVYKAEYKLFISFVNEAYFAFICVFRGLKIIQPAAAPCPH
jgi:hypothetical protein